MQDNIQWLKQISPAIGYYLAGFADGEGSFNVSLRRRDDHAMGWQVVLTFNVSQKDSRILAYFKRYLGCGRLQERQDGVYYYVVSNPRSIIERIIPFFEKYRFLSSRKLFNFAIFKQIAMLVEKNQHLTQEGLNKIVQLHEKLNEGRGRKRKYNVSDYQQSLQENPQRLYARPLPRAKRSEDDIVRSHG
ncbi:hypothetical protein A3I42_04800 [Candidatus Uhrbacteria bacterium RIFCSPLOWO2_02_FULL_49_11]|uniref:Homing endonuclease LAGLIDADG domain-containing protein n=1 Tax=Candidatus Uhrbacteria bacterium RIFCSPLOWO2_02_FULL_49_11 TaxID=1802409 RepID=A0A1F7VBW5_9BACT|nr:MAG: hypothetical protein A3I42_04800 [Candidatus Uhrbacteria bacterium RIFCSPLOWO2_02_FULL_49_11]